MFQAIQRKLLLGIDFLAFGILGAAAGQHWLPLLSPDDPWASGARAVVGCVPALLFVLAVAERTGNGNTVRLVGRRFLLLLAFAIAGSVLAVRSPALFIHPSALTAGPGTVRGWPALHFLSLTLFAGLALTLLVIRILQEILRPAETSGVRLRETAFGILLPAVALTLVHLRWGLPSFQISALAALGGLVGLALSSRLERTDGAAEPEAQGGERKTGEHTACIAAAAVLFGAGRYLPDVLPGQGFRSIALSTLFLSLAAVLGTFLGAGLANLQRPVTPGCSGLSSWQVDAGGRVLTLLLATAAGAVAGGFVDLEFPRLLGGTKVAGHAALLGGLGCLLVQSSHESRSRPPSRTFVGIFILAWAFLVAALPAAAATWLAALALAPRVENGQWLVFALIYAPVAAGSIGLAWRVHRLYQPARPSEWIPFAWGWSVTAFLAIVHQEVLGAVLDFSNAVSSTLQATPWLLALLATVSFLGRPQAGSAAPAGVPPLESP